MYWSLLTSPTDFHSVTARACHTSFLLLFPFEINCEWQRRGKVPPSDFFFPRDARDLCSFGLRPCGKWVDTLTCMHILCQVMKSIFTFINCILATLAVKYFICAVLFSVLNTTKFYKLSSDNSIWSAYGLFYVTFLWDYLLLCFCFFLLYFQNFFVQMSWVLGQNDLSSKRSNISFFYFWNLKITLF